MGCARCPNSFPALERVSIPAWIPPSEDDLDDFHTFEMYMASKKTKYNQGFITPEEALAAYSDFVRPPTG